MVYLISNLNILMIMVIYRSLKKELNWEATSQNEVITVFDLKGYSSKIGIIKSLSEEF